LVLCIIITRTHYHKSPSRSFLEGSLKFGYFNQTVALVGESGSGKSTVISLLQRFYDPDSGQIKLDGTEIQKLQLKWFRQQMGLVSQEPVLFNDTIRANIAYGKGGNATETEIIAAAELANAHKFISSLQQVNYTQFMKL
jgi:ATP-binding cassette subfamily B (MDR/TAP) protein 1